MRMGLQVSADRGRYATKVEKLQADARWADEAGLDTVWTPQIPDEFDVMTAATLIGAATSRIEVGTSVVPIQPRHPVVLAQQALSAQAVCEGRFTLGIGRLAPLDHRRHARPALRATGHHHALLPRRPRPGAAAARAGRGGQRAVHDPPAARHHRHHADAGHDRRPRAGDAASWPASAPAARCCGWPTSAPSRRTSSRMITEAAEGAGRPAPRVMAGVPVCLCARRRGRGGHRADEPHPQRGGRRRPTTCG